MLGNYSLRSKGYGGRTRPNNNYQPNSDDGSTRQQQNQLSTNIQGQVPLTGFEQNITHDQIIRQGHQGHQYPSSTWIPSPRIPSSIKSNPLDGKRQAALLLPSDLTPATGHHQNNNISIGGLARDVARIQLPPTPTYSQHSNNDEFARTLFEQHTPSIQSDIVSRYNSQVGTTNSQLHLSATDDVSNQGHQHGKHVRTQDQFNQMMERRLDGITEKLEKMIAIQHSNLNNNEHIPTDLSSVGNASGVTSRIGSVISIQNSSRRSNSHQNVSSIQNRQTIDILPKYITYNGSEMVTSPVLLAPGDVVYWNYSQGMMVAVEVLETTHPTLMRRQPIYLIKTCSSKQTHEVRHDDLFITKDNATSIDQAGIINANTSVLTATDRLDMHAIGRQVSPDHMQRWASMRSEKFKFGTLQTSLDTLCLGGDSLTDINIFHETLSTMLTSASKGGTFTLPRINELSTTIKLRDIILPPPSYRHIEVAKAFYDLIARMISTRISNDSFTSNAPRAKTIIVSVANGNLDGFDQLNYLYQEMIPRLGAINFNVQEEIAKLVITDGMLTVDFIALAQNIKRQLDLSGIVTEKNALLKQFFAQVMQSNLQALLVQKNHAFQSFRRNTGNNQEYNEETIQSLSQFILSGNPPPTLSLTDRALLVPTDHNVNNPSAFTPRHPNPSNPSFSRPQYAAALLPDEDDATVQDDIDTLNPTEEEKALIDQMIKPYFAALSKPTMTDSQKQHLYSDLTLAAMNQRRPRVQCEACLGNHDTDQCRARGPNFQDEQLRMRIKQVNAKYGDTPKRPPVPSTPPTASFGGRHLAHKAMTIHQPDQASQQHDESHELQYHSMQNSETIEATLSKISDELEQSVADNKLLVNPKLAIVELAENKITTNLSENRDLADAMQIGDYSVYNEQVNC